MTLHPAIFAATIVLIGSTGYDPQILTVTWPDGHVERVAATSPETCAAAVRAVERGLWVPVDSGPVTATCAPGDLFPPGSGCIKNYNCDRGTK